MSQPDTRARVTDAAERCFLRYGVAKTTIDDIAAASGISRATIYRAFSGGRDEVILEVILREAGRFVERFADEVDIDRPLATVVIDGILYTLREVRDNETFAFLYAPEAAGHAMAVTSGAETLFDLIRQLLAPLVEQARATGQIRPELEVDEIGEFLQRMVVSLLIDPGWVERSEEETRLFLERFVLPVLVPDDARVAPPRV
jgi:AcrR family transcriptional regulator